jgi:hypothetical protein
MVTQTEFCILIFRFSCNFDFDFEINIRLKTTVWKFETYFKSMELCTDLFGIKKSGVLNQYKTFAFQIQN